METAALSYSGSDLWVLCTEHSRLDHLSVCRTGNGVIGGGKVLETARGHGCREGVGLGGWEMGVIAVGSLLVSHS